MPESNLLVNTVLALGAGFVGAVVAARLRQSVILGFIVAGIIIGPFTPGIVGNLNVVNALADLGVIFLMFAVGVQLSLKELLRVGKIALLGGSLQVLVLIGLGYGVGILLGWGHIEAFCFGAVISNSSSIVLSKTLGERGELETEHSRISLAWSSVQDTSTIILVVIITVLATGGENLAGDLLFAVGKVVLFLALLLPFGMYVLPWLFERVADLHSRELFILAVAGVALGTAFASSLFGISIALGAFLAGVIVGESDLSHQILGEVMPLRDIFAGLFFVSIGMLVNPMFIVENPFYLVLMVLFIILVKGFIVVLITLGFGFSARIALLTGVTLAQSAEFSFLLARVGLDLGVLTQSTFSLMLTGAAVSIAASPGLHRIAHPFALKLSGRFPGRVSAREASMEDAEEVLRGHAVICGFGRVGSTVGEALSRQDFDFIVIDEDRRIVQKARQRGIMAFCGNAANQVILDQVHLDRARVLVLAIPDPLATRQIVDYARTVNPRLDIVARTHSIAEGHFLHTRGAREAVVGELELALEMTRHTMRRFGLGIQQAAAIVHGLRERAGSLEKEW